MIRKKQALKGELSAIVDEIELQIKKYHDVCFQKIPFDDGDGIGFYLSLAAIKGEGKGAQIKQATKALFGLRKYVDRLASPGHEQINDSWGERYPVQGYKHFKEDLAAIHEKSVRTRLPFSVILIQPDYQEETIAHGGETFDGLMSFVEDKIMDNLDPGDLFYLYPKDPDIKNAVGSLQIIALIMPATGIKRARQVIEAIKKSVSIKNEVVNVRQSLSVGLQVSNAGDFKTVEALLNTVKENLQIAARSGDCLHWQYKKNKEKSCQVTAEERAQLFSFLR